MPRKTPKPATSSEKICVFCHLSDDNELKYGKIYEHDGIVTHYYCLLLSSNMQQRGRDEDGILGFLAVDIQTELKRGRRLICSYCKKNGATLGCCNVKCKKVFHYPCGIKNNTLHQFYGEYKSFCVVHRPKRHIAPKIQNETSEHLMCYICYDHVHRENIYQTLWAPCCKKNAWFHRDCVQQLALSAGYFFKCPLCNNKKEFQEAMLDSGIFVPSQDASWELVPNAFQELLYRHNKCDAAKCICPHGREYTSTNARWELVLCRTCGSQGIHMGCGNLKWMDPVWDCEECSTILNKNGTYQSPNHGRRCEDDDSVPISNGLSRQSGDESSDSDVSIGTDFPTSETMNSPNCTPIVLRPGPRSAKLKQLLRHAETRTIETSASNTSLEQLKDILNEQQAHHSISDDVLPPEVSACVPQLNTDVNKPENTTLSGSSTRAIEDVILLDSDEDETAKQPETLSTINKSLMSNDVPDCTISYMNIQISEVTSLPPEVFASVPDTPITSENTYDAFPDPSQSSSPTYLMKRKADSSDVVSQIVQRINDSIDSPDITSKRPRVENNLSLFNIPNTPISSETHSVLRGVSGGSYRNGVSLSQAAIVTVNGKEYVVPLENMPTVPSSTMINAAANPTQSNSDGDAGTKRADSEGDLADDGTANSTKTGEYPRGRGCDDHGIKQSTMCKQLHGDESSSWDGGARINRNRLMRKRVRLRDLKFYIYNSDTITMNYRDKLTMNIAVGAMRECETVNNRAFFCNRINSRWASRVRGSDSHQNNNKKIDRLGRGSDNETIDLKNYDGASDLRDRHTSPKDSTHFLVDGSVNDLCKYQLKESTKDNLVPDMFGHTDNFNTTEKLSSPDQINKRFRYENNDENNIVTSRNYTNAIGATSIPGTSKDELRKLTNSYVNQKRFTSSSNKYTNGNRKLINWRRKSLSSYFDQHNIRCCVSIDLDRIPSIFDEIPNLTLKKDVSTKHRSFEDLRMCSTGRQAKIRDCNSSGSLTRSKSDSYISSIYNNNNPSKTIYNYISEMDLKDLKKRKKVRKRNVHRHTIM